MPRIRIREAFRSLLGIALVSAFAGSAALAQTPPEDMKLSLGVVFPHDFSCKTFDSQAGDGRAFWRLCESKQDDVIATMQTGLFPPGSIEVDPVLARSLAQTMIDAATVRLVDGKWDKVTWIDYQGGKGFEAIGHRLDGRMHRLLSITKESRIFFITGIAPAGRPEIDRFFNSVRLN
jgi:hypothetical protein